MSNNALNFGSGNHYRSKLQIFLESKNLTQIAIQIKGKMSKHWPSEHRLTKLAHLYLASNVFIFMQLFVYFSSFSIKIAPCYGILGNNLLGMLKCLSLKYYPGRDTETSPNWQRVCH